MDKININDFPTVEGASMIPTKLLKKLIDFYNHDIEIEEQDFLKSSMKNYQDYLDGKMKAYTEEEYYQVLNKEGL